MKPLFFSLLLFVTMSMNAFAADTAVSPDILKSFKKTFSTAKDVTWSTSNDLYKADFVYRSQYITAYYDAEGNMLALTKNILSTELPLLLGTSLREHYSNHWISEVLEVSTEDGSRYYVTLENADEKVVLKSVQNNWSVAKKVKK